MSILSPDHFACEHDLQVTQIQHIEHMQSTLMVSNCQIKYVFVFFVSFEYQTSLSQLDKTNLILKNHMRH
jgi:hypothetical protein